MMNHTIDDRYQILKLLHSGLSGITYLAQALEPPEKPNCILKQFKPQSDDSNLVRIAKDLFNREPEALHQIGQHPQIPQILDYFETDESLYLVRKYIAGETLREIQERRNLWNAQQSIAFLESMLTVLAFIHQKGIIHRDIKPDNIILRSHDQKLFLIDFGAAKLRSQMAQTSTSSIIIHSHGYTPPEQLQGYAQENSDLYALGMTCIEMLLGEKPVSFAQSGENSKEAIQKLEELAIDKGLRSLLEQMICIDSGQRYPSASAVLTDLVLLKTDGEIAPLSSYTPTLIGCSNKENKPSANLGYTPTQSSLDSPFSSQPSPSRTQNSKYKSRPSSSPKEKATQPLPKTDPIELECELNKCLNHETPEFRIRKTIAILREMLVKHSLVLLLSIPCVAIGFVLIHFFYSKSELTQPSSLPLPVENHDFNYDSQTSLQFQIAAQIQDETSSIRFLKFTPQGQTLIFASDSGLVNFYNLQNKTVQQLTKTSSEILAVACTQYGEWLTLATANRSIEVWNLKTMKQVQQISTEQLIWSLAIARDGVTLAAGGLNTIKQWSAFLPKLRLNNTLEFSQEQPEPVRAMALSNNGLILAGGDAVGRVKVIHLNDNQTRLFRTHTKAVNAVLMDASETVLLTGSDDDTIRIWNLYALQEYGRPVIQAELGGVTAIALHPNNEIIAAGGAYGTIKLWNWKTGQLLGVLSEHITEITALAFNPDGESLAVGTRDGKIAIFSMTN